MLKVISPYIFSSDFRTKIGFIAANGVLSKLVGF